MAQILSLKPVTASPGPGPLPPLDYDFELAEAGSGPDTDLGKKIGETLKGQEPSVWFLNFPDGKSAQSEILKDYMKDVLLYRSWASTVWWGTVFGNSSVPQGDSPEDKRKRNSYLAKVAATHMKKTPWLATNVDHVAEKNIECQSTEFHSKLITDVLEGFIIPTKSIKDALETVLTSLTKTVKEVASAKDYKTIICEKYEYIPQTDTIRSYVRVISFGVSEEMQKVARKNSETITIKCHLEFSEYEAVFDRDQFQHVAATLRERQNKAGDEFIKGTTIDCPPP